jgi:hypothetical protein
MISHFLHCTNNPLNITPFPISVNHLQIIRHQVQQFLNVNKVDYHKSNLTYSIIELANSFVKGTHIAKCTEAENLPFTPTLRHNNDLFMVKCLEDLFLHLVREREACIIILGSNRSRGF